MTLRSSSPCDSFSVRELLFPLDWNVPPGRGDDDGGMSRWHAPMDPGTFGVIVMGPPTCGKSSIAFQSAVNAVLHGDGDRRALVLAHPSTAQQRPVQPLTPVDTLPPDALERLEFAYPPTARACCQVLAAIGTSLSDRAGAGSAASSPPPTTVSGNISSEVAHPIPWNVPHAIMVDFDTLEDREDPLALAKLLAVLSNTVGFIRECVAPSQRGPPAPHFVVVLDGSSPLLQHHVSPYVVQKGGPTASAALLHTFPLSTVPLGLVELTHHSRGGPGSSGVDIHVSTSRRSHEVTLAATLTYSSSDPLSVRFYS